MTGKPIEWTMLNPGGEPLRLRMTPTGPGQAVVDLLGFGSVPERRLGRVEKEAWSGRWLAIHTDGSTRTCLSRQLAAGRLAHDWLNLGRTLAGAR